MNNLLVELLKIGIKPDQAAKYISEILQCNERTARNKLKEVTDFTVPEAVRINEALFKGEKELGYLFKSDDDADRKGA